MVARAGDVARDRVERFVLTGEAIRAARVHEGELPALQGAGGDRLRERPAQTLIAMCGSGVTACHNLLALEAAGLPGARLYAGSWSEWIRDPARPVARGAET